MTEARSITPDGTFLTADQFVIASFEAEVMALLDACSVEQKATFGRVFPGGVELMTLADLRNTFAMLHRTIRKNREGAAP